MVHLLWDGRINNTTAALSDDMHGNIVQRLLQAFD